MTDLITPTSLAAFEADVLAPSHRVPVVVDFWAAWCGPCRTLAPILESVARELGERARICKVDTDAEEALAAHFQIRSIPTVLLFRDGRLASRFVGVQPAHAIQEWVRPFLAPTTDPLREQAVAARARGDDAGARSLLAQALAAEADDHASREELADLELAAGNVAAAREALAHLERAGHDSARLRALAARLWFADELTGFTPATSDLDQLYAGGLGAATRGEVERAAADFLTLTERSRAYRDDAGRRALLKLFELVGPDSAVTGDYRRRLARTLH